MSKKLEIGCKKCSGVITVERNIASNQIGFRIKDGEFKDKFGKVAIKCLNKNSHNITCGAEINEDEVAYILFGK